MKVADILNAKTSSVFSVTGNTTVFEALQIMGEKNIGALLVMDSNTLSGIFSERDYARKIILRGRNSHDTLVQEIMTGKVITVLPEDSVEKCMELMSEKDIRHLPVLKNNTVSGMVSMGDVVKTIIKSQKETIDHLQSYISQ